MESMLVSHTSNFNNARREAAILHHRAKHTPDLAIEKLKEGVQGERKEVQTWSLALLQQGRSTDLQP